MKPQTNTEQTPNTSFIPETAPRTIPFLESVEKILALLKDKGETKEQSVFQIGEAFDLAVQLAPLMELETTECLLLMGAFAVAQDDSDASFRSINRLFRGRLSERPKMELALKALCKKGLMRRTRDWQDRSKYAMDEEVVECLMRNEIPNLKDHKLDPLQFSTQLTQLLRAIENRDYELKDIRECLDQLSARGEALAFFKNIPSEGLLEFELLVLMVMYVGTLKGESSYSIDGISRTYIGRGIDFIIMRRRMQAGDSKLFFNELIEWIDGPLRERDRIGLTKKGKDRLFGEDQETFLPTGKGLQAGLVFPEQIKARTLFYNQREQEAIDRLNYLLGPAAFQGVCAKLQERNMQAGMGILLFGGPGTGKTETVLQLAKQSGRAIKKVEISGLRDKWVGESEKHARALFTEYRKLYRSMELAPILFLNEADGIFGKRLNVSDSVDQMNNSMQNIFLEEMEQFEGILIATTNLEDNLDSAFDRRFLFKLKFDTPSAESRALIFKERILTISHEEAQSLGDKFILSGGQIDNVARKLVMEELATGTLPNFELVLRFCEEEQGFKNKNRVRVGFN